MKKILKIIGALLISIIMSYKHHILYIPKIEFNIKYNVQFYVDIILFVALILYLIFLFFKTSNKKLSNSKKCFICLLDIFLIISNSFIETGNLQFIYSSIKNVLINLLYLILNYIILKRTLILIEDFIKHHKFKKVKTNSFIKLFESHPFLISLGVILIFWLIYIVAFYPIILSPDPSFQIKQFFNIHTKYADYVILLSNKVFLTNHHPVIHTLLLGASLLLGRSLGSDNLGLFFYSIIQFMFLASTLAYTIKYLKQNNINTKILLIVLAIYCLVPMYSLYSMSGVKDTIYTCFIIWYVIFIDKIIRTKNGKIENYQYIYLLLIMVGASLFRNNGIYVIFLSFPFVIIYCKKIWKQLLILFLGFLSFYTIYTKIVLPSFKITDGSIRETLSIPFQQTARYVKYYEDDLTKNEIKVIDKVLGYKTLADRYDPLISDPVKNVYNKYATKSDLKNYLIVWFKCFFKHPMVYIEATLNNIYGYFSPQSTNWYVYHKYDIRITEDKLVDYHYNNLNTIRTVLSGFAQAFPYIPFIGLISNIGFNTWLLLGILLYLIILNKKENILVISPLLISLLVCVASPVNTYFRYTMPFIFIMPFIFTLMTNRMKKQ